MNSGPRCCKISKRKHDKLRRATKIILVNIVLIQMKTFKQRQLHSREIILATINKQSAYLFLAKHFLVSKIIPKVF